MTRRSVPEAKFIEPAEEEIRPAVVAPSTMTEEIFVKHFNARHAGGHPTIHPVDAVGSWPDQMATFRAYHLKLHSGTVAPYKTDHDHVAGTQPWQDPEEKEEES